MNYLWDFNGDGFNDASGMRVNWRYDRAGIYNVRLQVTDNLGAVTAAQVTVQVVAPPPMVRLDLSSSPSGADVYLDGTYMGRTPTRFNTTPGWHQLRVTRLGDSWETQINLTGLESLELDIDFD
jgi:PKD repeat protein